MRFEDEEIQNLLRIVKRDLKDSQSKDLSNDWHFAIAYNAALQAATAALPAAGYRASRDSHHYRVIQSLSLNHAEYDNGRWKNDCDCDGEKRPD